jgi:glyoxylase-like metal-dependent hydrolase (beta-lactamase superfamily II)
MAVDRLQVGEVTVFALPDGDAELNGWPMAAELDGGDPVDWSAYARRSPTGFHGPDHRWRIHNNCYLVKSADSMVLVDCGVGIGPYPWYASLEGRMTTRLAEAGYSGADISHVFLTHAHPDHVGWAYDETLRRPRFSNARYFLHERDWVTFSTRDPIPRHFQRFVAPLRESGVLHCLTAPGEIAPGVESLETPGHTAGHMSLLVRSRGEGLVIAGDVLNSPMYVTEPERPFGSDADQRLAIETRIRLVDQVAAEGWRVAAEHFPEPGWGEVISVQGRRWFRAL